jgi:putative flippase GtrA
MKTAYIKQQLNRQNLLEVIRFGIVGSIAAILQIVIYLLLAKHIGHNLALFISYALALIVNFLLTTYFTFRVKASKKRGVGFLTSHAINFLLQFLLLNFYISIVGLNKQIAIIPVLAVCIPINFLLIRYVMKKR